MRNNPRRKSLQRQMMGGREEGKGGLPLRGQQFLLSFKELLSCECCQETAVKMRLCECVNVSRKCVYVTDNHS